jgi:hypothetical protein
VIKGKFVLKGKMLDDAKEVDHDLLPVILSGQDGSFIVGEVGYYV